MLEAIRESIPIGRENAARIEELALCWRCNTRTARKIIAEFRRMPSEDGTVILSSSRGRPGYWRSRDSEEILAFVRETESSARNTFLSLREARRVLRKLNASGQMTIDGLAAGGGADG